MPPDVFAPLVAWEEERERQLDRAARAQQEEREVEAWMRLLDLVFYETRRADHGNHS